MSRRQLTVLASLFFLARLCLVLCASDQLSEPDSAEVKMMEFGDAWLKSGEFPGFRQALRLSQAGANAPHGAYLPLSLLYTAFALPFGDSANYLALKCVALLFTTASFIVWLLVLLELAPRRSRLAIAWYILLFSFPPATFLAGTLVPWGSHPESILFLGLAALSLVRSSKTNPRRRTDLWVGLSLGLAAAMNSLMIPAVFVLSLGWSWDRREHLKSLGLPFCLGAALFTLILWTTGGLSASVTETAGSSPIDLVRSLLGHETTPFLATLKALIPLPLSATTELLDAQSSNRVLLFLFVAGSAAIGHAVTTQSIRLRDTSGRAGRLTALFIGVPCVHLLSLAIFAPRRPFIPPRYLLVLLPILIVCVCLAWATQEGRIKRLLLGGGMVLTIVSGLTFQLGLYDLSRIQFFQAYRPSVWLEADIGHVRYETAQEVNRFIKHRGVRQTAGFNFAAGVGASDSLPQEAADSARLDPSALLARRSDWLSETKPTLEGRRLVHENIGWGIVVFAPEGRGNWHAVLTRLSGTDRVDVAQGIGLALGYAGDTGCNRMRDFQGPDRPAVLRGFESIRPESTCFESGRPSQ
jgi:hypothetical protein